jgi:hypothetical protein
VISGTHPWAVVTDIEGRARAHHEAGDDDVVDFFIALATGEARAVEPGWYRVTLVLRVASLQEEIGDANGARETALQTFSMARDLPALEPCSSFWLLSLLALPERDAEERRSAPH